MRFRAPKFFWGRPNRNYQGPSRANTMQTLQADAARIAEDFYLTVDAADKAKYLGDEVESERLRQQAARIYATHRAWTEFSQSIPDKESDMKHWVQAYVNMRRASGLSMEHRENPVDPKAFSYSMANFSWEDYHDVIRMNSAPNHGGDEESRHAYAEATGREFPKANSAQQHNDQGSVPPGGRGALPHPQGPRRPDVPHPPNTQGSRSPNPSDESQQSGDRRPAHRGNGEQPRPQQSGDRPASRRPQQHGGDQPHPQPRRHAEDGRPRSQQHGGNPSGGGKRPPPRDEGDRARPQQERPGTRKSSGSGKSRSAPRKSGSGKKPGILSSVEKSAGLSGSFRVTSRQRMGPFILNMGRNGPVSISLKTGPTMIRIWSKQHKRGLSSIDLPGFLSYRGKIENK